MSAAPRVDGPPPSKATGTSFFRVAATVVATFTATVTLVYIASVSPVFTAPSRRLPFTLSCLGGVRGGRPAGPASPVPTDTPAPPVLSDRDPWLTAQACTLLTDESELCDYKGPVCLALADNGEATVYVSHSSREMEFDTREWCYDARGLETSWPCGYGAEVTRPNLNTHGSADPTAFVQGIKPVQSAPGRSWGPEQRKLHVLAVPRELFIRATPPEARARLGPAWAAWADVNASFEGLPEPGASLPVRVPWVRGRAPKSVKWLNDGGAAYITSLDAEWNNHPWHFSSGAFQMFAAKMHNGSSDRPGSSDAAWLRGHGYQWDVPRAGMALQAGGQLPLPPMDQWWVVGPWQGSAQKLSRPWGAWVGGAVDLLVQPQTRVRPGGHLKEEEGVSEESWLCATRAVVTGLKPRVFTGPGEANAFRLAAYAVAGVSSPAYPHHPPQKITILLRIGRGREIKGADELRALVEATGLPFQIVEDMEAKTWKEQVTLMSETGILIAAHGAGLANMMYMPAKAVVIEVFP